jgi:DNA-binding phage protein
MTRAQLTTRLRAAVAKRDRADLARADAIAEIGQLARAAKGVLTMSEVADLVGITRMHLYRIVRGR